MENNRRLTWVSIVVGVFLTFAIVLKLGADDIPITKEVFDGQATPIVFSEQSIILDNQKFIDGVKSLVESISEMNSAEDIENEALIKRNEIQEEEIRLAEEEQRKFKEIEEKRKYKDVTLTLTFYTGLESENGKGRANMNAIGGKLVANQSIAVPRDISFGSVLEIENYGKRIVDDRGSKKYIKWLNSEKTHMKVDLYVARNKGETDKQYWKRVNNMGIVKDVKAKLYIKEE